MREDTRHLARRALISLAVVALAGFPAVSCGEQPQSADRSEKSAQKAETARAPAPAAAKPAGEEKTAETTEAKKPEEPRPEKAPAKQPADERTAEQAAQDQYAAKQYASDNQYAARQAARERGTDPASPSAPATAAPSSTTLSLTVPKLGLYGVPVVDDVSEAGLSQGAGHLPGTGFPWQGEGSNTYIAGHRLGYPGTPSDHVFYGLPNLAVGDSVSLTDADGATYDYAVSEIHEVSPTDLWVSAPVAGRDVVTLQTCIEDFGDEWTPGPDWLARYIVRADRV